MREQTTPGAATRRPRGPLVRLLRRWTPKSGRGSERARLKTQLVKARAQRDRARRRLAKATSAADRELDYLFVVTYGRSGSTLLQGILNSIPGYLIRGENRQVLRHLHDYHRACVSERTKLRRKQRRTGAAVGDSSPVSPFYGLDDFPPRQSLIGIRQLALATLLRPEDDTRVAGFKEIRWADDDVDEFVDWLQQVFPGARFVINTRNLDEVSQSKWWADTPDALAELTEVEERLLALRARLGDQAFHLRYDDYVHDPAALAPFFDWLGEEFDLAAVTGVLDVPHSY